MLDLDSKYESLKHEQQLQKQLVALRAIRKLCDAFTMMRVTYWATDLAQREIAPRLCVPTCLPQFTILNNLTKLANVRRLLTGSRKTGEAPHGCVNFPQPTQCQPQPRRSH